jgi:hypothetical protein
MEGVGDGQVARRVAAPDGDGLMRYPSRGDTLLILALFSATQLILARQAATAATPPPAIWAKECGSARLGLEKVAIDLAQPQNVDTKDGKRVAYSPDSRGRYTPVIVIHGWMDRQQRSSGRLLLGRIDLTANRLGKISTTRSLIGQFQDLPGAAVFTFDYNAYSARWSTTHTWGLPRQGD